jgi:hypothetical protein
MSVLDKIDNFLEEDNKEAMIRGRAKIKAKLPKKLADIIKEQDEAYADELFDKMADFINGVDVGGLSDEQVLQRNALLGELYHSDDVPYGDDDDFTGEELEADDAEDIAADEFDADFGDELEEPEEYQENTKLQTLLKGKK